MNRRNFFGLVMLGAAAATPLAAATVAEPPMMDTFPYHGYRVKWMDWREPMNQVIAFGCWAAFDADGRFKYATTMGGFRAHTANECETIDTTWERGEWPSPAAMLTATPQERDAVKRRTLTALLEQL